MRPTLVLLLVLPACAHGGAAPDRPHGDAPGARPEPPRAFPLRDLLGRPESELAWRNTTSFEPGETSVVNTSQSCRKVIVPAELDVQVEGEVWRCETLSGASATAALYVDGPTGWGHFASRSGDGPWQAYAVKIELPPTLAVGDAWSGTHGEGDRADTRSCTAVATPYCAEGVATECITRRTGGAIFLRQHYCTGTGWVGHDAVVVRSEGPVMIDWSAQIAVDGRPAAYAEHARRPLPDPATLREAGP